MTPSPMPTNASATSSRPGRLEHDAEPDRPVRLRGLQQPALDAQQQPHRPRDRDGGRRDRLVDVEDRRERLAREQRDGGHEQRGGEQVAGPARERRGELAALPEAPERALARDHDLERRAGHEQDHAEVEHGRQRAVVVGAEQAREHDREHDGDRVRAHRRGGEADRLAGRRRAERAEARAAVGVVRRRGGGLDRARVVEASTAHRGHASGGERRRSVHYACPMTIRITLLALLCGLLLAPAAALAQSAGDDQYADPFGDEEPQQAQSTPAPAAPAPAPAPAATPAPAALRRGGVAQAPAAAARDAPAHRPRRRDARARGHRPHRRRPGAARACTPARLARPPRPRRPNARAPRSRPRSRRATSCSCPASSAPARRRSCAAPRGRSASPSRSRARRSWSATSTSPAWRTSTSTGSAGLDDEDPGLLDPYFGPDLVTFVEWPERRGLEALLGERRVARHVELAHAGGDRRRLS